MRHLTITVPAGNPNQVSVLGTYMLLKRAEKSWSESGKEPVFNIVLAGITKDPLIYDGIFSIQPSDVLERIPETDVVIIPALQPESDFSHAIEMNQPLIDWVSLQYKQGAAIVSICTGAFLLASTGIMNGRSCSTHWGVANQFRKMFPAVNLVTDKIVTEESGIFTSGGAFSFLNFILYLVEKYYDRRTAIFCSKLLEIDMDRSSQSPFEIFSGQKNHSDEGVKKAQEYIEKNYTGKFSVNDLANMVASGRRNFDRRFKKVTGNTPLEYLQRVKIEAAKKRFESTRQNISEVMFEVGYSDLKAFRSIFKKYTGLSPLEYRSKYNKDTLVMA